jgi:hypothetical protein
MNDFRLKFVLSILGGVVFSLLFILLAFALPLDKNKVIKNPTSKLEKVSQSFNK